MERQRELLTVQDFAGTLRVTPACVRRWITERKITIVKIGRLVRIPSDEVDKIVSKGTRPAQTRNK